MNYFYCWFWIKLLRCKYTHTYNSTYISNMSFCTQERYNEFDGIEEFHCHFNNIQSRDNKALKKLLAASCMCLFFMVNCSPFYNTTYLLVTTVIQLSTHVD